ncbi:MAG: DUF6797 domain-containing protein, partial [Gemmataceae bacterium]
MQTYLILLALSPAAEPPGLHQRLAGEPPAALAKDARARGDAARGAVLFFQPFLTCAKCHDGEAGTRLGPDLSRLGKDATAEHLVESVLLPSKAVRKGYETVTVTTTGGRTLTGLVAEETGTTLTLLDPSANGKHVTLAKRAVERREAGAKSLMPDGLANLLSDRQQFLDLAKYLIEVAEQGPARAKELRPTQAPAVVAEYEKDVDHAGLIRSLDGEAFRRGEAIYARVCANCHGTKDAPGSMPTSPRFASAAFKNGTDLHSLYQTLTRGYGMMAPQTWMVPRQKYDVLHYIREAFLKPHNPSRYAAADAAYLAGLPKGTTFGPPAVNVQPWVTMDYGPSLMNTYEVGGPGPNFAYKGIAARLDPGPGGVSRGKHWALFDHDTLRLAAAWSGDGFIDYNGIHFNGRHAVHPALVGDVRVANPAGPGWADPDTGSFADPRPKGRDGRRYGPLPRAWARYVGTYHFGDRTIVSYAVGGTPVLEASGAEADPGRAGGVVFTRTLEVGPAEKPLSARIAPDSAAGAAVGDARAALAKRDGYWTLG